MINRIEQALLNTRKRLFDVCKDLDTDLPDRDELTVDQCSHCNTWHWQYRLQEDLDGNPICTYCEDLVGL